MNKKILIYGSEGWIGRQFCEYLQSRQINFIKGNSRLEDEISIENEILNVMPNNIIAFTGRTHGRIGNITYTTIDYLEQPGKLYDNLRDNLYGPLNMSMICEKLNIHFTYLGTGCIFEYDSNHKYANSYLLTRF